MSSGWAAVAVAGLANLAAAGLITWRAGRWAGTISAALEELRRIGRDHEKRLRVIEGGRRPPAA